MTEHNDHTFTGEIVKWYTRARRFPQLIGKTPDGATIWGGPYTYTQVIGGAAFFVALAKTTWIWGSFGFIGNTLILFAATAGLVVLLGRLPLGSRSPLSIAAGILRAYSTTGHGRYAGAPIRIRPPQRIRGRLQVLENTPSLAELQAAVPARPRNTDRPRKQRWRPHGTISNHVAASIVASPSIRPTPATVRTRPAAPLTGVQQALASANRRLSQ